MVSKFKGSDNFNTTQDHVLQVQSKLITLPSAVALAIGVDTLVHPEFFLDFVPLGNGSTIHIECRWFGERSGPAWDTMFNVYRDANRINAGANNTGGLGIACMLSGYFNNSDSTPDNAFATTTDVGGTVADVSIRYALYVTAAQASTLYTNRCVSISASQADNYEQGTSEIIITEYGAVI